LVLPLGLVIHFIVITSIIFWLFYKPVPLVSEYNSGGTIFGAVDFSIADDFGLALIRPVDDQKAVLKLPAKRTLKWFLNRRMSLLQILIVAAIKIGQFGKVARISQIDYSYASIKVRE